MYGPEILTGEPSERAKAVGWDAANKEADEPLEEVSTYKLSWGSPRENGFCSRLHLNPCPRPANRVQSPRLAAKKRAQAASKVPASDGRMGGLPTAQREVVKPAASACDPSRGECRGTGHHGCLRGRAPAEGGAVRIAEGALAEQALARSKSEGRGEASPHHIFIPLQYRQTPFPRWRHPGLW